MHAAKQSAGEFWANYEAFGVALRSNFPIHTWKSPRPDWDLSFTCRRDVAPGSGQWSKTEALYTSPYKGPDGTPVFYLYRNHADLVFHYPGTIDFHVQSENVTGHLFDPSLDHWVEIHLLGAVLPWYLEQNGILALHASAVALDRGIVAFMGSHGKGKSTLATAFLRRGSKLVADDILAVEEVNGEFRGRPGCPQLRLWPGTVQALLGSGRRLERISPQWEKLRVPLPEGDSESFCRTARPLSGIYLMERTDSSTAPSIRPIRKRDGVVELLRNSFLARLIPAMGREEKRLSQLTSLAGEIPLRRLEYPSGFERLDEVVEAVLGDT